MLPSRGFVVGTWTGRRSHSNHSRALAQVRRLVRAFAKFAASICLISVNEPVAPDRVWDAVVTRRLVFQRLTAAASSMSDQQLERFRRRGEWKKKKKNSTQIVLALIIICSRVLALVGGGTTGIKVYFLSSPGFARLGFLASYIYPFLRSAPISLFHSLHISPFSHPLLSFLRRVLLDLYAVWLRP